MTNKKNTKLIANLRRVLLQYIMGKSYTPLTLPELAQKLIFTEEHIPIVTDILHTLIQDNLITETKGRFAAKKEEQDLVTGILRIHHRGFGFLQPESAPIYKEDIFIPKNLTMNAIDGDKVEVMVNTESVSEKGPEGKVIRIIERSRSHIAGIITHVELDGDIYAYVPLLGTERKVIVQADTDITLKAGDRISMQVIDWGSKEVSTLARFHRHIGSIDDPSSDIQAAIEEFEIRSEFPSSVIKEAESFGSKVKPKDLNGREDLRSEECFTIDPDTAKDFDDALSLKKDKKGHYHLGVHIADVCHYVRVNSELDKEASLRCNSTYFPRFCVPMLPPTLSDNLCSLKPNVVRLTSSVFCEFDPSGTLVNYRIARSFIKSAHRFTYNEAKLVLDGKKKSPHEKTLHTMVELCHLLKTKRYERGSIEFSLSELVVQTDEKGNSLATNFVSYDITHQLVEEFMLKANEIVAWHLSNLGKDLTYRIHDSPAEENMRDFANIAAAFGFKLSADPSPLELQKLFDAALNTPYGPHLATSFIRRQRLAVYSPENIGHYGLGLTHYCHFTSPIRRYVDLAIHRILFEGESSKKSLFEIAERCSEQERVSSRAEGSVILLKKLRLLHKFHEEDPYKEYEAIITRVKPFGISFEVLDLMLEGFLKIFEIGNDYYVFDENRMQLKGRHTGKIFATGTRILVQLKSLDFIFSETSWSLSGDEMRRVPANKISSKKKVKKEKNGVRKRGKVKRRK